MFGAIVWIVVLISSHDNQPSEVTHIPSFFKSQKECESYLIDRFKEDDWGEIDKNYSGEIAYWRSDSSGTLSTYVCLAVHPTQS